MVHIAMFDCGQLDRAALPPIPGSSLQRRRLSQEAAAAAAASYHSAGTSSEPGRRNQTRIGELSRRDRRWRCEVGWRQVGETVAQSLAARANAEPSSRRLSAKTKPGAYVPTPIMSRRHAEHRTACHGKSVAVRPKPADRRWTARTGRPITTEAKNLWRKLSAKRSPQQTETARFWLMVGPPAYHPVPRQRYSQAMTVNRKRSVHGSVRSRVDGCHIVSVRREVITTSSAADHRDSATVTSTATGYRRSPTWAAD